MKKRTNIKHITMYEGPEESPGYLLWRVSTQWRTAIEQTLKQYSITHPQFVVLASLGWLTRNGAKVSQIDVGRMASMDPNTTSQIIRGLEKRHFIRRQQSVDERSKNPLLTVTGAAVIKQALPAVEHADIIFFKALTEQERTLLVQLFSRLVA